MTLPLYGLILILDGFILSSKFHLFAWLVPQMLTRAPISATTVSSLLLIITSHLKSFLFSSFDNNFHLGAFLSALILKMLILYRSRSSYLFSELFSFSVNSSFRNGLPLLHTLAKCPTFKQCFHLLFLALHCPLCSAILLENLNPQ